MTSKDKLKKIMGVLGIKSHHFYEAKNEQGLNFKVDGDLQIGSPIYVQTEEGLIPAPDGQHMLDDGAKVDVVDGKIEKIGFESSTEQTEVSEEKMSLEKTAITYEGDLMIDDGKILRPSNSPARPNTEVKMVQYDGTLTAVADGLYTTTNGDVYEIVGGEIKTIRTQDQMKELKSQFAEAKSKSGHKVMSPSFKEGDKITFEGIEGTEMELPDGKYELEMTDGKMTTVMVEDGKIASVDTIDEIEDEMEKEKTIHPSKSEMMSDIEQLFTKSFSELTTKIESISKKQEELEKRFFKFSNLPAGEPIRNNTPNNKPNSEITGSNRILEGFRKMRENLSEN